MTSKLKLLMLIFCGAGVVSVIGSFWPGSEYRASERAKVCIRYQFDSPREAVFDVPDYEQPAQDRIIVSGFFKYRGQRLKFRSDLHREGIDWIPDSCLYWDDAGATNKRR